MSEDLRYIPANDRMLRILDMLIGQNTEILNFNFVLMRMLAQPMVVNREVAEYKLTVDPELFEGEEE
jgi:hypothetical protein